MAKPDFLNANRFRSFPFQTRTVGNPGQGPYTLRNLPHAAVVDCGFTLGPESGFDVQTHSVRLVQVARVGNFFYFSFAADTPQLIEYPLVFRADLTAEMYGREFVDSDIPEYVPASQSASASLSFYLPDSPSCGEPFWSGYCVFGDLQSLAQILSSGDTLSGEPEDAVIEPALIYNLDRSQVVSLNIANADRTRATAPAGCPEYRWTFPTGQHYVAAECLQGVVVLQSGRNTAISQNRTNNSFNFSAVVNSGLGEVCEELKLFPFETPPVGATNNLLGGDFRCNETLRTVNGLAGPDLNFIAGNGVTILPASEPNTLLVAVDFSGLALCDAQQSPEST